MVADAFDQREAAVVAAVVEVVVEDAADSARLVAMLRERNTRRTISCTSRARRRRTGASASRHVAVKMDGVLGESVIRRQVHPAAEPPGIPPIPTPVARPRPGVRDEHPHVEVHGRRVRIARMQHERDAHRLPRASRDSRARTPSPTAAVPVPLTCEKLTPPRSSTLPSSISREMPPPPSGRVHSSRRNGLPSIASSRGDDARLQVDEIVAGGGDVHRAAMLPRLRSIAYRRRHILATAIHPRSVDRRPPPNLR